MSVFGRARFLGTALPSIALQTRLGSNVPNQQSPPPEPRHEDKFRRLLTDNVSWRAVARCSGVYNCHGMVWANRRTSIYESTSVQMCLEEDGCRIRPENEPVCVLDIVIYRDRQTDEVIHSGLVAELPMLVGGDGIVVPQVVGKLDDTLGEVVHPVGAFPYPGEYSVEYWTHFE